MSAKRYFQLSYIWPVAVPALMLVLPHFVRDPWIGKVLRAALGPIGIPCVLFGAAMVLWSRSQNANRVRRSTYLAPLLYAPVQGLYLLMACMVSSSTRRLDTAELAVWFFIIGFLILTVGLTLGYSYVGVLNLAFVGLRSWGAFQEAPECVRIEAPGGVMNLAGDRTRGYVMSGRSPRAFQSRRALDPFRAAVVAAFSPLVLLGAYAFCRHLGLL